VRRRRMRMRRRKKKLQNEAISEILVAETNSESGAEGRMMMTMTTSLSRSQNTGCNK